jgi:hypothetical protein
MRLPGRRRRERRDRGSLPAPTASLRRRPRLGLRWCRLPRPGLPQARALRATSPNGPVERPGRGLVATVSIGPCSPDSGVGSNDTEHAPHRANRRQTGPAQTPLAVQDVEERSIKARLHPIGQAVHLDLDPTAMPSLSLPQTSDRGATADAAARLESKQAARRRLRRLSRTSSRPAHPCCNAHNRTSVERSRRRAPS